MNLDLEMANLTGGNAPVHPLMVLYEERLSRLIGFISRFIIYKECQKLECEKNSCLNEETARKLCEGIIEEARLLVGPVRTLELETELHGLTNDYFEEGRAHEG